MRLLESGWWDERVTRLTVGNGLSRAELWHMDHALFSRSQGTNPHPRFIRAIAAVLLFGEWSEERWPLVEAHEARRWAPGIMLGVNREELPTRLAGVQVFTDPNCPEQRDEEDDDGGMG